MPLILKYSFFLLFVVGLCLTAGSEVKADWEQPDNTQFNRYTQSEGSSGVRNLMYGLIGTASGTVYESSATQTVSMQLRIPSGYSSGGNDDVNFNIQIIECDAGEAPTGITATSTAGLNPNCTDLALQSNVLQVWLGGGQVVDTWYERTATWNVNGGPTSYTFIAGKDYYYLIQWNLHATLTARAFDLAGAGAVNATYEAEYIATSTPYTIVQQDIVAPYLVLTSNVWGVFNSLPAPFGSYEMNYSSQYNTRFTNVSFASTSLDVSYYIDPTEATSTQPERNPTLVTAQFSKRPSNDITSYGFNIADAVAPTWGTGTTTVEFGTLDMNSIYDVYVSFSNPGTFFTGIKAFPLAYAYVTIETDAFGDIATATPEFYDAVEQQSREYQPCSITEVGGCIANAFIYTFMPSDNALEQFASLRTDAGTRAPFIYITQIPELWGQLYGTASSASLTVSATTSIGQITFISKSQLEAIPLSSMIRDIIGGLLWVMLAFTLYHRGLRLFDHNEKTV